MSKFTNIILTGALVCFMATAFLLSGCSKPEEPLKLYAGKGLRHAVEDIKALYEKREGVSVEVVYAGSATLLNTIEKTRKGDVYLPGSKSYINDAGPLITRSAFVGHHVPTFAIRRDTGKKISRYEDLLVPGVRIAIANENMAAIGRVANTINKRAGPDRDYAHNIVVLGSTVNELIQLVVDGQVDAALIWTDMLKWTMAKELVPVTIPSDINLPKEIWVGELNTTKYPNNARKLFNMIAEDGKTFFKQHGFKEAP
ncbi:substrate-binding domain-containing protein [Magnetococcales bacterium HHB-1]